MPSKKIIIDADPGIGDALAILLALFDPQLDLLALTATAGAVSARDATCNMQRIIEQVDPPKHPRIGAATASRSGVREMLPGDDLQEFVQLNGPVGLGEQGMPVAELHHRHEAAKLLTDLVRAEPNAITLITLGPLTNVAAACERFPEFLSQLAGLVCLGGAIAVGGDLTAAAEANMHLDPDAARFVLRSPATKTLVPLDVSRKPVLTFDLLQKMPGEETRLGAFLHQILPYALRAHHQFMGTEGVPLSEVAAVAACARPDLFRTDPMALDIETTGELTRGATIFDRRGIPRWQSNIEVVTEVNVPGVLEYLVSTLQKAGV